MKIYFPVQELQHPRTLILQILKQLIEKQFAGFKTDSLFSLSYDRKDQFFFKGPHAILWGKVYFEPFANDAIELLRFELGRLQQTLKQRIHAHIFFTDGEIKKEGVGYPCADYFRYRFIQSETEKSMLIEKVLPSGMDFRPDRARSLWSPVAPGPYPFSKSFSLSREELAELIDLNLELKRHE